MGERQISRRSTRNELEAFVSKARSAGTGAGPQASGRLIFALDATASREPTWDRACAIQGQMFEETSALGGLEIQLCYYRGYDEFRATGWLSRSRDLLALMRQVSCLGGYTQLGRVLRHTLTETRRQKVDALVFVGDCMEEDVDRLCNISGQLGIHGVPAFMFQEGTDRVAATAFEQIARLSGGAYCHFNAASAGQLRDLLGAVAVYASGGRKALADYAHDKATLVRRLSHQIRR